MSDDERGRSGDTSGRGGRGEDPLEEIVGRLIENLGGFGAGGSSGSSGSSGDGRGGGLFGDLFGNLGDLGGLGGLGGFGEPDDEPGRHERRDDQRRGPNPGARTPTLDRHGRDLTAAARAGRIDPVIGRDREIAAVLEVLGRRSKNNAVLVGDPGVGKTAIAEGIAARVAAGDVPRALQGCRVVALDLAGMVAGTKYRGEFEQRMRRVIDEVTAADRGVVLFLDEFHTLVGAGAGVEGGAMDAADILKPALARGDLQVLGATTMEEYRKHVESDAALERRFAPVTVAEPTVEQAVAILDGLRARYEDHHDVRLPADACRAAVELTARHVRDRFLPDKAIDALDTVAARVRLRHDAGEGDAADEERRAEAGRRVERLTREQAAAIGAEDYERAEELRRELEQARTERDRSERERAARPATGSRPVVTVADVAAVVADISGVPVAHLGDDDRDRLLGLADRLRARVVGQDDAVETVADAVLAGRAGMSHPGRPVASLLFAGPTGVGKTELARALAAALFGDEERMVRFDLGEFREAHTVNRLVGAPPGYAGHDRSGELTEAVRRTPYCVVLLDEIEKAHVDVQSLLLGVLDAGRLTDGRGRTVSFADTVIIMTTNLGAGALTAGRDPEDAREEVTTALAKALRPEFLGRVDETVLFGALDDDTLRRIVGLQLDATRERLAAQDLTATVTGAAVDALVARPTDQRPPLLAGLRGVGALQALVLDAPASKDVAAAALEAGFIVNAVAPDAVRVAPPLVLTDAQLAEFTSALPAILQRAAATHAAAQVPAPPAPTGSPE